LPRWKRNKKQKAEEIDRQIDKKQINKINKEDQYKKTDSSGHQPDKKKGFEKEWIE